MINLLPPDNRKQLRASISNIALLQMLFFFISILLVLIVSISLIFLNLVQTKNSLNQQKTIAEVKAKTIASTKRQAEVIKQNLAAAGAIFNEQVHYSNLLVAMARALPSDALIRDFKINATSLTTTQTLQILVPNSDRVIAAKHSLESAGFISSVSVSSVANNRGGGVGAVLVVTFNQAKLKEVLRWQK